MNELFDPTSWTKIRHAAHGSGAAQEDSLNTLARAYQKPLLTLARMIGIPTEMTEDAVQEVMASVFSPRNLAAVNPANGRFCHYLAASLRNKWHEHVRHEQRQRRDVRRTMPLDDPMIARLSTKEGWMEALDAVRAEQCLDEVRTEMESEAPDTDVFLLLWSDLLHLHASSGQAERAMVLGIKPDAYRQRLGLMRTKFRRLFRETVAAGLTDPAELEAECLYLLKLALKQG